MAVYVDPIMEYGGSDSFPWKESCHMYADIDGQLHEMATKIGLKRSWFQNKERFPHYDLTKSKRRLAVRFGAIEVEHEHKFENENAKRIIQPCQKL